MFCSNCGETIDEGSVFCKECGAPAPRVAKASTVSPPAETTQVKAPVASVPPAGAAPGATPGTAGQVPPPPPSFGFAPPPPPLPPHVGYAPGWQSPPPPPRRTGLIVGIVVAVIVVLAGAGVGAYFGLRGNDSDKTAASSTTVSTGSTTSSAVEVTTTVTIPIISSSTTGSVVETTSSTELTTSTEGSTTTEASSGDPYLVAVDSMVALLEKDDQRIPELATQINNTAPNVPTSVDNELQTMFDALDDASTALSEEAPPSGFEVSDGHLQDAADAMGNRIDATINGVQAMRDAHSVNAGSTYFDLGRQARDDFKAAYQKFQETYPVE